MFTADPIKFGEEQLINMEKRKSRTYLKTPDEKSDDLTLKLDRASIIYSTHCASCHQNYGQGQENIYPPLAESEWVNGGNENLIRVVLFGQQGEIQVKNKTYNQIMPSFSFLSDNELAQVISHIKINFGNKGNKVNADEVRAVRNKK